MARRTIDYAAVRSISRTLPDVNEGGGRRGLSLKVKGRLLACQAIHRSAEPDSLMVCIGSKRRRELLDTDSAAFYLTDHYAPYSAILVRLSKITRTSLRALLAEACEFVRSKAR
jgi:hypothetical protein